MKFCYQIGIVAAPVELEPTFIVPNLIPRCPASLAKLIEVSGTHVQETEDGINSLEADAYNSSENAMYVKKRAEELFAQVEAFMIDLEGATVFSVGKHVMKNVKMISNWVKF